MRIFVHKKRGLLHTVLSVSDGVNESMSRLTVNSLLLTVPVAASTTTALQVCQKKNHKLSTLAAPTNTQLMKKNFDDA